MIEPLRLSYEIDCPPDHAFDGLDDATVDVVAEGPLGLGRPRHASCMLEPRLGGRIFERTAGRQRDRLGRDHRVGPAAPPRLPLAHRRATRDDATDVELTFVDLGDGTTRLDIVHSGWERLGDEGVAWREANTGGWSALIPSFVAAAEA